MLQVTKNVLYLSAEKPLVTDPVIQIALAEILRNLTPVPLPLLPLPQFLPVKFSRRSAEAKPQNADCNF